ncbi:MAG: GNAT family N-acetyltransferase [Chitinivibrionales bacterium]
MLYFNAMDDILIEAFEKGEEFLVSELIKTCFDEFVAPGYSSAGNNFFYAYIEPEKIIERFIHGNVLLTAKNNGKIVGVIEVRDHNHVSLLFVDKLRHGRGIAKRLMAEAVALCREKDKGLKYFEVNASPYSEKVYVKMGFKKTSDIQNVNGLKFIPMVLKLA